MYLIAAFGRILILAAIPEDLDNSTSTNHDTSLFLKPLNGPRPQMT